MRPRLEVADILRALSPASRAALEPSLSREQRKVVRAIQACRTAALGGHLDEYAPCGDQVPSYNSCRDRHCPKCQAQARERWLAARTRDLLPVTYFHVVFTIPAELAEIALRNKQEVYGILFRAAWETLRAVAADPKHLGAEVAMLAVLHTWDQRLRHHPHLHCLVPGGGLSPDGGEWVECKRSRRSKKPFLVPVKVLSRVFRRRFLARLEEARARGRLVWVGRITPLASAGLWRQMMAKARAVKWNVDTRPAMLGPEKVLKYLGRYTHRVAITNHRLVSHEDGIVRFRYRDRRDGNTEKVLSLGEGEFIRRFLQHVLPRGFQRLRQYGLLANRGRKEKLERARELLGAKGLRLDRVQLESAVGEPETEAETESSPRCPVCGLGRLRRRRTLEAGEAIEEASLALAVATAGHQDSS